MILFQIASAQDNKSLTTNTAFLRQNGKDLAKVMNKERKKAWDIAKQKGWTTFRANKQGKIIQLVGVDGEGLPIYEATTNETAAGTTQTNKLYTGGILGLNLNGSTIPNNKVALWDGGSVLTTHQEFAGSRIIVKDGAANASHGTHVAGTIAAAGINNSAKGMAYGLPQLLSYDFNNDNSEMSLEAANLLLSNHSYGRISGWSYNDVSSRWEFYGRWGDNEDYNFGYYDSKAQTWDNICYNAPYYLPIKSAGNNRNDNGPVVGGNYYRYNTSGVMVNAGARPAGMSNNDGYDIIPSYGTAKNILTVGAIYGLKYGASLPSEIIMSSFSSWGPTDDGRIKPDLVADGVSVISANNTGNDRYVTMSGTSMAAPNVTGSLVLLQELYYQKYGAFMRSASLKGLAIATTNEAGPGLGPDYQFGWGLLNAEKAAKAILNNGTKSLISERTLTQGQTQTIQVVASGNGPLLATICWTDPAVTPISTTNALNNPTLRLINDLDMRIGDGVATYYPWILDPSNPAAAATTGDNFRDNVEQIYIANAIPGKTYTITIGHKNNLQSGSQPFSLIVTGVGGTAYCASAPASSADSKITAFTLSNLVYNAAAGCTSYTDNTAQTITLERGRSYNLSLSVGTCGSDFNKIAKVFIDWNGDGDFDDADEAVAYTGLINANGMYGATVTVPTTVIPDNYTLLRIVLVETSAANDVQACGTYAKGETQDYRVKFTETAVNVGLNEIVSPINGEMAGPAKRIMVKLKNYGANTASAVPVNILVKEEGVTVTTINETYYGSIAPNNETTFLLQTTFNAQSGKTYTIDAQTALSGDVITSDNLTSKTIMISNAPSVGDTKAYYTDITGTYYLTSGQNNGTLFWYDAMSSTTSFSTGNAVITTQAPAGNNTYYVGLNNYLGNMGPASKAVYGSGTYGQAPYNLYFTTKVPLKIESARLYIGYRGAVTFNVYDANIGVKVSSSTISVNNTRNPASTSTSASDISTDVGQVYQLDIIFPYAGSFYIVAEFNNGATLFRNNGAAGTAAYPFTENTGLFSLVSHTGASGLSMNNFWYFFYDLKAKPIGETLTTKQAVILSNLTITQENGALISPIATGNQWYLNGNPINGATAAIYQPVQQGNYMVKITLQGGLTITSNLYQLNTLPVNLNSFTAKADHNKVILNWTVSTEVNVNRYEVERLLDGTDFTKVAEVTANGSSNYTAIDVKPELGMNYYRLKAINNDETLSYFNELRSVKLETLASKEVRVYPNPLTGNAINLSLLNYAKGNYSYKLTDVRGKIIQEGNLENNNTENHKIAVSSSLPKGMYILYVINGKELVQAKLVKQ
ncbi:S8 family serine peptidase [Pedobacter sp.]|uniref:S8 family serine peptidase n=1 Tax=Pedobacter sp. TaxID=1411316 RepID=UPI00396C831F